MANKKLSAKQTRKTLATVLRYLRRYRWHIVLSVLLAAISVGLTLYTPIVIGDAIDCIIDQGNVNFEAILPLLIRVAICAGIIALSQWLMSTLNNKITFEVVRDTRSAAFRRIQSLPLSYLDTKPTGEIVSRVIADVDQFADGLLLGFTQLFIGILFKRFADNAERTPKVTPSVFELVSKSLFRALVTPHSFNARTIMNIESTKGISS